ncbi:MOSC domain-containing protein [Halomicrobium salinisoli]|uniref:MOSC domain-containing protein n=1 Tax=Halomicrobium salinisoli TaxID=2878391 RepID=UPI001CEFB9FB|nr:MOSC domain-containing protein [Halomicrobium salinisoli]
MQQQELLADHDVLDPAAADPHLAHLQRFPVKSLDPEVRETATLVTAGALDGDREWATLDRPADEPYDPDAADVTGSGDYVNGKKTDAVHRIRSTFHPRSEDGPAVTLRRTDENPDAARRFPLYDGRADGSGVDGDGGDAGRPIDAEREREVHAELNDWLSDHFGRPVSVRWDGTGQQDDRERHGPTVVSTATLREIAAWFDFDLASARRRFRANLEIGGVPPFWEDRLFVDEGEVVAFRVGDGVVEGIHPCQRCVVPGRDPDTGAETPDFRETFVQRRRETKPEWTDCDRFDHDYRLMVNTRVPDDSAGTQVEVGDSVEILETRPE